MPYEEGTPKKVLILFLDETNDENPNVAGRMGGNTSALRLCRDFDRPPLR